MSRYPFLSFFLLIFCVGCFEKKTPVDIPTVQIKELAREVQVPKALMVEIEEEMMAESTTFAPLYVFLPLTVQFTSISPQVLSEPVLQYVLPKGGGDLDLKDIVIQDGSFYMSFPSQQFADLPELVHLYYISNSPVRQIDNENYGMGCGKWNDLKSSFSKLQKDDFLKLNTTDLRYLAVVAGRYVFVFRQGNQVYLTQLTISDSRFPQELCMGDF